MRRLQKCGPIIFINDKDLITCKDLNIYRELTYYLLTHITYSTFINAYLFTINNMLFSMTYLIFLTISNYLYYSNLLKLIFIKKRLLKRYSIFKIIKYIYYYDYYYFNKLYFNFTYLLFI